MGQPVTVVDAFTHRAFAGNPAAVCVLPHPTTDAWMQQVAREMRHSETAYAVRLSDGGFELRWFTPGGEVKLCGHATLATAHVLWEEGRLPPDEPARFQTLSGALTATPDRREIELDFPALPATEGDVPAGLLEALGGVEPSWVGQSGDNSVLVLADAAAVRACAPDFRAVAAVQPHGVMVTAPGDEAGVDFVSRFFAPAFGIDEDPVTGSAHCTLAPLWAARLDKPALVAHQLSERGGELLLRVDGERVKLRGTAVTTLRGSLTQDPPERPER